MKAFVMRWHTFKERPLFRHKMSKRFWEYKSIKLYCSHIIQKSGGRTVQLMIFYHWNITLPARLYTSTIILYIAIYKKLSRAPNQTNIKGTRHTIRHYTLFTDVTTYYLPNQHSMRAQGLVFITSGGSTPMLRHSTSATLTVFICGIN